MAPIHSPWEAPDTRGINPRGEISISYTHGAGIFPLHVPDQQRWYQYGLNQYRFGICVSIIYKPMQMMPLSHGEQTCSAQPSYLTHAWKTTRPSVVDVNRIPEGPFLNDGLVIHRGSKGWAPYLHREIRSAYRWLQAWARHASVVEGCVLGSSVLVSSRNWVCTSSTILSRCHNGWRPAARYTRELWRSSVSARSKQSVTFLIAFLEAAGQWNPRRNWCKIV